MFFKSSPLSLSMSPDYIEQIAEMYSKILIYHFNGLAFYSVHMANLQFYFYKHKIYPHLLQISLSSNNNSMTP